MQTRWLVLSGMLLALILVPRIETSGGNQAGTAKWSGAVETACPAAPVRESDTAAPAAFGESTIATNFLLAGGGFRNFVVSNVGGAERIRISLLTNPPAVGQLRLRVFFTTPGAPVGTGAEGGDIRGNLSTYTDVLTGSVPVHGSTCTIQVVNDGSGTVAVSQLTAYWATN
ncbi:MAG: hypothetical protein HY650_05205 [Acidobacteria bacterium]|nr:hypothetical protein [Acidobacteriota bacterium]